MRMELNLQLSQTLEMRQEMRLELQQQILELLPEFEDYITFETEEDVELLEASFPFLMLHELSHPLHSQGYVIIPEIKVSQEIRSKINQDPYLSSVTDHHAIEIGIDRSAILVGQASCGYSEEDMIHSNVAMIERVYKDIFDEKRISPEYGLIARLDAELRLYKEKTLPRKLHSQVKKLREKVESHTSREIQESSDLYNQVVSAYKQIYQGSHLSMKKGEMLDLHEYFGARLK